MPTKELLDFIQASRAAGQTDEQTKTALRQNGWQDAAFEEAFRPPAPQIPPPQPQPVPVQSYPSTPVVAQDSLNIVPAHKSSPVGKIILIIAGLLVLGGGAYAGYHFLLSSTTGPSVALLSPPVATSTAPVATAPLEQSLSAASSTSSQSPAASTSPLSAKETFLAMTTDYAQLAAVLPAGVTISSPQGYTPIYRSTEFKQFITRYTTDSYVKGFESAPDAGKGLYVLGIGSVLPDMLGADKGKTIIVKEATTSSMTTLSYSKNGGTVSGSASSTSLAATCTIKMIVESNVWKVVGGAVAASIGTCTIK